MGSAKSGKPLLSQLSFRNATSKVTDPKLSDHEKCNVECLNQSIHHQNAAIDNLGHLFELHQGTDTDDTTQQVMVTVLDDLQ